MTPEERARIEAIREGRSGDSTMATQRWLLDLVERQAGEIVEAREEFRVLLEETAEDMRPYVSDFFAEKWGHDRGLERAHDYLDRVKEPTDD